MADEPLQSIELPPILNNRPTIEASNTKYASTKKFYHAPGIKYLKENDRGLQKTQPKPSKDAEISINPQRTESIKNFEGRSKDEASFETVEELSRLSKFTPGDNFGHKPALKRKISSDVFQRGDRLRFNQDRKRIYRDSEEIEIAKQVGSRVLDSPEIMKPHDLGFSHQKSGQDKGRNFYHQPKYGNGFSREENFQNDGMINDNPMDLGLFQLGQDKIGGQNLHHHISKYRGGFSREEMLQNDDKPMNLGFFEQEKIGDENLHHRKYGGGFSREEIIPNDEKPMNLGLFQQKFGQGRDNLHHHIKPSRHEVGFARKENIQNDRNVFPILENIQNDGIIDDNIFSQFRDPKVPNHIFHNPTHLYAHDENDLLHHIQNPKVNKETPRYHKFYDNEPMEGSSELNQQYPSLGQHFLDDSSKDVPKNFHKISPDWKGGTLKNLQARSHSIHEHEQYQQSLENFFHRNSDLHENLLHKEQHHQQHKYPSLDHLTQFDPNLAPKDSSFRINLPTEENYIQQILKMYSTPTEPQLYDAIVDYLIEEEPKAPEPSTENVEVLKRRLAIYEHLYGPPKPLNIPQTTEEIPYYMKHSGRKKHRKHKHRSSSADESKEKEKVKEVEVTPRIEEKKSSLTEMNDERLACDQFVNKRMGLVRSVFNWVRDWVTETAVKTKQAITSTAVS